MNDEIETQEYRNRIADLKEGIHNVSGFSPQNLKYCSYFYRLYADSAVALSSPQVVDSNARPSPQLVDLQKEQGFEPKAANPTFLIIGKLEKFSDGTCGLSASFGNIAA